jgi:hypothetical protein
MPKHRSKVQHGQLDESPSIFAAGFCQGWLTNFAHTQGQAPSVLTERVSELLHASRERHQDPMLYVSPNASSVALRLPAMEVAGDARGGRAQEDQASGKRPRRRLTAKERHHIRVQMRKNWRKRKAAEKASAQ